MHPGVRQTVHFRPQTVKDLQFPFQATVYLDTPTNQNTCWELHTFCFLTFLWLLSWIHLGCKPEEMTFHITYSLRWYYSYTKSCLMALCAKHATSWSACKECRHALWVKHLLPCCTLFILIDTMLRKRHNLCAKSVMQTAQFHVASCGQTQGRPIKY